jgi:hypothetical protein
MKRTSIRLDPIRLGVLVGAVVAFVVVGAFLDLAWILLGGFVGGGIGWVVGRFLRQAVVFEEAVDLRDTATKAELYEEATKLGIEGRSTMTKDELVVAITDARSSAA